MLIDPNAIDPTDYGLLLAAAFVVLEGVLIPHMALASHAAASQATDALKRLNRGAAGILAGTAAWIATHAVRPRRLLPVRQPNIPL